MVYEPLLKLFAGKMYTKQDFSVTPNQFGAIWSTSGTVMWRFFCEMFYSKQVVSFLAIILTLAIGATEDNDQISSGIFQFSIILTLVAFDAHGSRENFFEKS